VIDPYFYDRDGNPIAGRAPTAVQVVGNGTLSLAAAAEIERLFLNFSNAHRLGLYESLIEEHAVDPFTHLRLEVNHGVFTAVATVTSAPVAAGGYCGIAVQLFRVTDPTFWNNTYPFGDLPPASILELLPEHDSDSNSYDVPGPLGRDGNGATDTLIFQIAARGALSIAAGTVKIFRIRAPGLGQVASHDADGIEFDVRNEQGRPVVTAAAGFQSLGPFFLHGQTLAVPSLTGDNVQSSYGEPAGSSSLFAHGFKDAPFDDISVAQGVLIYADGYRHLHGYDMARPDAGWQVLAEAPESVIGYREYGLQFDITEAADGSSISVVCYGEDGRGALSGYRFTLTRRSLGGYSMSGELNRIERTEDPNPQMKAFNKQASWSNTLLNDSVTMPPRIHYRFNDDGTIYDISNVAQDVYVYGWTLAAQAQTSGQWGADSLSNVRDNWTGEVLAQQRSQFLTFNISYTSGSDAPQAKTLTGNYVHSVGGVPGYYSWRYFTDPYGGEDYYLFNSTNPMPNGVTPSPQGLFAYTAYFNQRIFRDVTYHVEMYVPVINATVVWDATQHNEASITSAELGNVVQGNVFSNTPPPAYNATVSPTSGIVGPFRERGYDATDCHRNKYALRYDFFRQGSWLIGAADPYPFNQQYSASMAACLYDYGIYSRGGALVPNSGFSAVDALTGLDSSGAYTTTFYGFGQGSDLSNLAYPWQVYNNPYSLADDVDSDGPYDVNSFGSPAIHTLTFSGFFAGVKRYTTGIHDTPPYPSLWSGYARNVPWSPPIVVIPASDGPPAATAYGGQYAGSFSAGVNVNGVDTITYAEYEGFGDIDLPDSYPGWTIPPTDPEVNYLPGHFHWTQYVAAGTLYNVSSGQPNIESIDSRVLVDPRTGGFIAQAWIQGERSNTNTPALVRLVIGNEDGCVPLADILNEWLRAQNIDAAYADGELIINPDTSYFAPFI
jgi:hypothetical protein